MEHINLYKLPDNDWVFEEKGILYFRDIELKKALNDKIRIKAQLREQKINKILED